MEKYRKVIAPAQMQIHEGKEGTRSAAKKVFKFLKIHSESPK